MWLTGRLLVAAMCIGQLGNLLPHVTVPAIMVQSLMPLWGLNATEAGVMASGLAVGYMLAVPVLTTLTDRIDARFILAVGSALSGLATICFGIYADGLLSATLIWAVAGIGFAGAYMPGLKALTDRLPAGDTSRSVTLYTASFSVGVGLSFLVAQLVAEKFGWRAAFYVTGAGPFLMVLVCIGLAPCKPPLRPRHSRLLDFAPVLRNRTALGYILGYGAHCFELYGMRTWIVAFWTFVMEQNNGMAPLGGSVRERHRDLVVATSKRVRERSGPPLRASPRHHYCHGLVCGGCVGHWLQYNRVPAVLASLSLLVWPYRPC